MKKIGIIGGGFSGTMAAVQLIEKATEPIEIIVINEKETFNKGIAFNPYSTKHLLNVVAGKMSAFPNKPDHFLDWILTKSDFQDRDRTLVANSFLPRAIYGEYLTSCWNDAKLLAESKGTIISFVESYVTNLEVSDDAVQLEINNGTRLALDYCVIASGNHLPRNPRSHNQQFYTSKRYFQNPWGIESVQDVKDDLPVLIIGNGLTMVDTVLGLTENGFKGEIYSISPNGFSILPHRHNGIPYTQLVEELREGMSIYELVRLINKHIKTVRAHGISAEPIIDSLRPHTQRIWQSFSENEKQLFMSRLRHLWGVARHRIPLHTHDKIQQLRIDGKLRIQSGNILELSESNHCVTAEYYDKKEKISKTISVSRVINCTGPETDFMQLENSFLKKALINGILTQDPLKLGIKTDISTYQIMNADGNAHNHLFTLGSNLKGELWESTAVNELRKQASELAEKLLARIN